MPTKVEQEVSTLSRETEQVCMLSIQTRRQRPSPLVWRFVVTVGDSIVLTGSLVATLALLSPSYAGFNVSNSPFGLLHTPIIWLFLVIASWSIAVSITQGQEVQCT